MDSLLLTFGLVFVAGLLASATPCVYPMFPITAAIFAARGEGSWRRSRLHAVIYFLGIICFYALVGLLAATTGTALSAIMTNAWVHVGFAVLFAYLGLSMLGLYELQLFSSLMARLDTFVNRVGGFSGHSAWEQPLVLSSHHVSVQLRGPFCLTLLGKLLRPIPLLTPQHMALFSAVLF